MKTYYLIILISLGFVCSSQAQRFSKDYWHEGEVDLDTKETLKGAVFYNLETDIIQVRVGEAVKAYSAQNVLAFQLNDALTFQTRYFFTLPFKQDNGYTKSFFFELLKETPYLTILTREKLSSRYEYRYDPFMMGTRTYSVVEMVEQYFIMTESGEILRCSSANNDELIALFPNHQEALKRFAREQNLYLLNRFHLWKLFDYYESL